MGNIIGMNNQDNYNDISSTIPYLKKMEKDAKNLVLNISEPNVNSNGQDNIFTETENYELYKIFEKNLNVNNHGNEFSDTSPFISSDAYNNLMKNQTGGGEDDSSTSSSDNNSDEGQTSDIDLVSNSDMSEEDMSEEDMSEEDMSEENMSEENMSNDSEEMVLTDTVKRTKDMADSEKDSEMDSEMNEENMSTDSEMSTGNNVASYFSSSAHSDNIDSSTNVTTISVGNRKVLSDSINTSDINMISIEE